uniref:Transcriptional corepressor LEUNIG-like n=1 Tax=Nelumbo nucifera TaxID=4432 RepID=A0A822XPX9_NELNU|nr:TPA_asm: hypothetical protein HUJ06_022449 [Nelumbo nucifera]
MMAGLNFDARMMLDRYLYDYFLRKNMHTTAWIFKKEAEVADGPLWISSPEGFLWDWWSLFYDVYTSRERKDHLTNEQPSFEDYRQGISLDRFIPLESTSYSVPEAMFPRTGLREAELNKGVFPIPLNGLPLTGFDQIPSGLGKQILKSVPQTPVQQQFQMLRGKIKKEHVAQALPYTPQKLMPSLPRNITYSDQVLLKDVLKRNDGHGTGNFDFQHIGSPIAAMPRMEKTAPTAEIGSKRKDRPGHGTGDAAVEGDHAGSSAKSVIPTCVQMECTILPQSNRASRMQIMHDLDKIGQAETLQKMDDMDGKNDSTTQQSSTTCDNSNNPKVGRLEELTLLRQRSQLLSQQLLELWNPTRRVVKQRKFQHMMDPSPHCHICNVLKWLPLPVVASVWNHGNEARPRFSLQLRVIVLSYS